MLVKRSFSLSGHRTSVALEPEFWTALERMAARAGHSLGALVASLDASREPQAPLASRLRVAALQAQGGSPDPLPVAKVPEPPSH